MISVIVIFCASVIIGLITWWYYEFFKHRYYLSKYEGPIPLPIIGNIYKISSTKDIIPVLMGYINKHGPVIRMWFGYCPRIIISEHKTAELLLGSTSILTKSSDYKFFEPWLGTGLLTSTGTKWSYHRKLLTPTFHIKILEQYINILNTQSNILVNKMKTFVDSKTIDIFPLISLCTLDIICESVMGLHINAQTNQNTDYVHSVEEITKIAVTRIFSVLESSDFFYRFTNRYKQEKRILEILHNHTNYVIKCREEEYPNSELDESKEDEFGIKKRRAFLDLLLESRRAGEKITTEDIREEVDTFMFGGHDTTSTAISFTLYCLSLNKQHQDKALEEICNILNNDSDKTLLHNDLQEMKYLEMVIKEGMRLYPPIPMIARELTKDTEFNGAVIPKGTNLTLFAYGLHRQSDVFPEPENFDPERFSPQNIAKRSPFAYVPFSAGIRNCIGQRFAMMIMKAVLSKILINFEILPVENYTPQLASEIALRSVNGILVKLKKRNFLIT